MWSPASTSCKAIDQCPLSSAVVIATGDNQSHSRMVTSPSALPEIITICPSTESLLAGVTISGTDT
jgi:hypothetical protein